MIANKQQLDYFCRALLVYESGYEREEVESLCFFVIQAFYQTIKEITNVTEIDHWKIAEESKDRDIYKLFFREIEHKYAGELCAPVY